MPTIDARAERPRLLEAEVCVIGTGAGGAVAAAELAARGRDVVALEEGPYLDTPDFTGRPLEMSARLYRDGGMTGSVGHPPILLPLGRCVGGTTTINSGTCFRTPDGVLDRWREGLGLAGLSPGEMAPRFDRLESFLGVAPVAGDVLGPNSERVRRAFEAIGLVGAPIPRNAPGCRGIGVCCFGCPAGAKRSMNRSFIPWGLERGLRLVVNARAERVLIRRGRVEGVRVRTDRRRWEVRARHVVVACGALLTPVLLAASGVRHPRLGRGLTIHPATRLLALFEDRLDGWYGVPQGFHVDALRGEGIALEGIHGPPALLAPALPFVGERRMELLRALPHAAAFGVMVEDSTTGRVHAGAGGVVRYSLAAADVRRLVRGLALCARAFLAAGARSVLLPVRGFEQIRATGELRRFEGGPAAPDDFEVVAFHPLGTCRMGRRPRESVVDPEGRAWEVEGLHVCDGSIVPTALGVNPQITIMALALRFAERFAG